jgi:queuine/archaeosine tRNA-ribosyltransferase
MQEIREAIEAGTFATYQSRFAQERATGVD